MGVPRMNGEAVCRFAGADPRERRPEAGEVHVWFVELDAASHTRALSRPLLRALLGMQLGVDGSLVCIEVDECGKPQLASPRPVGGGLHFNVSHSGHLLAFALARDWPVGIDIELPRGERDYVAIARRVFGETEGERLSGLDRAAREREFVRLWVRHEADLKCRGEQLSLEPRARPRRSTPWLAELDLDRGAIGALASAGRPVGARCWRWLEPPVAEP